MQNRLWNFSVRKLNSRLSIQLIISFFGMFMIISIIAFASLYFGIEKILVNRNERSIVSKFNQYEYNINTFCNDIDMISRQLISQSEMQNLVQYGSMDESDKIYSIHLVFQQLSSVMQNYKYVDSISYFGSDGLILNSSANGNYIMNDKNSTEKWFYQTSVYRRIKESGQRLVWFGGYSDRNFSESIANTDDTESSTPVFYVSAARGTMAGDFSGVLVLNIDAYYFTSIFNHTSGSDDTIFMTDDEGKIIASLNSSLIGRKSNIFQTIPKGENIRSTILTDNGKKQQVVSYRIVNLNSILISEIPFNTIRRDVTLLRWILLVLLLFGMAIALLISRCWVTHLLDPLNRLVHVIHKTGEGTLGLTMQTNSKNELGILIRQFNTMSMNIKELFEKNSQIEKERRRVEIDALRWQINPHFIYNTLDTIKWMAMISNENNIVGCVTTLSDFLEPIFRGESVFCTLGDEIKHYIILVKTYFEQLPASMEESASLDGAGFFTIFFKIIFPLSKPIIATIAVYCAVGQWNSWLDNYFFVTAPKLQTVQLILYNYLTQAEQLANSMKNAMGAGTVNTYQNAISPQSVQMAVTVVTIVPIMCVYPFLQKYFAKGIMMGAVKG